MHPILLYITSAFPHLSPETQEIIEQAFVPIAKKKGDLLLRQGAIAKTVFFLSEGMTRSFSYREGQDITTWFSFKNDFVTSFTSFFPREASYESIEMLSDGQLFQISYQKMMEVKTQSAEIERIIHYFSNLYTIQLEKRLFVIQTHSAAEKYQLILRQEPHLIQSIPNKYLASYLGITRETLSRIRAGIN